MKQNTQKLTRLALLSALTVLLANLPIKFGVIEMTLGVIPVAVGAITMGPVSGLILGIVLGGASFLQCLGIFVPSSFGATVLGINVWYTVITCFVSRALMGWLTGWIFRAMRKTARVGSYVASLSAALLNTVLFVGMVILFFWNSEYIQGIAATFGTQNVLMFAVLFAGINAAVEAVTTCLLAGTVSAVLLRVKK